jgi:ABC-type bacteriocin/lantibiotic exporter with double-glycine peptidase domain
VVYEGKKGKKNRRYYVNDPAVGRRRLTEDQFIALYDGITIQLTPRKSFQKAKCSFFSMVRKRMKGEAATILSLFLIALLLAVTGVAIPFFAALFIDGVLIGKTVTWFYTFLGVLVTILMFWIFFAVLKKNILLKLKNKLTVISDYRLFQHLMKLPFSFWEQRELAFYESRIEKNAQISRFLTEEYIEMLLEGFSAVLCLLFVGNYSRKLMLVSLCMIGFYAFLPLLFWKSISLWVQKAEHRKGRLTEAVFGGMKATASLKAAGAENDYVSRIMGYLAGSLESEQKAERLQRVLDVTVSGSRDIAGILVLMLGADMTMEGTLSIGQLVSCVMMTAVILKAAGEFLTHFTGLQFLKNDMKRVDDIWRFCEEKEIFRRPADPQVEESVEDTEEEDTEQEDPEQEDPEEEVWEEDEAETEAEGEEDTQEAVGDMDELEEEEPTEDTEYDKCADEAEPDKEIKIHKTAVSLGKKTDSRQPDVPEESEDTDQASKTDETGEVPEEMDKEEEPPITELTGGLCLYNVSFGFGPSQKEFLQEITFSLKQGEVMAIVGKAGSGKSTVLKLITGLYTPGGGEITYDEKQLSEIPREVFYRDVAVVGQQTRLFTGSIRENIMLWDKNVTEADMIKAAKDACIHDVIMKKKKAYDHMLLENGRNLSEGERQRLEIAAALAKNPSLLILDEATARLDVLTEQKVLSNIRNRGCSCILAVHRPTAIRFCDKIVVLEKGQIAQIGTHKELARTQGVYRRLLQNV